MGRIALYIAAIVLVLALLMTAAHAAISEASAQHSIYLPLVQKAWPTALSGVGPVTPTPTP